MRRFVERMSERAKVWFSRWVLLVLAALATVIAVTHPDSVLDLVTYAWGGMGAAFGPTLLLALYWRRFNFWGALFGMVVGTAATTVWGLNSGGPGGMLDIMPGAPGFTFGTVAAVAATLLTRPPEPEVTVLFDEVNPPQCKDKAMRAVVAS